jgi:hypothetical protein
MRPWIILFGLVVLIAGHGVILYYVSSHTAISGSVLLGVAAVIVLKHLGLFGPLFALFRRRSR